MPGNLVLSSCTFKGPGSRSLSRSGRIQFFFGRVWSVHIGLGNVPDGSGKGLRKLRKSLARIG